MAIVFKATAALCFLAAFISIFFIHYGAQILIVVNFLQFGFLFGGVAGIVDRLRDTKRELLKAAKDNREALARIESLLVHKPQPAA